MNNMNQNNGMQKRMLIMTLVVFVFFIAYEFLVLKPQQEAKAALVKQEQAQKQNVAPELSPVNGNMADNSANAPKSVDGLSSKIVASSEIVSVIKTAKNIIEIDSLGRVAQVTLLEEKYKDENGNQIKLFESNQLRPLEVRFADVNLNAEAFKVSVIASSSNVDATTSTQELILTQNLNGTVLTKKFTVYSDGHYDLAVSTTNDKQFFITNGFRPNVLADMYAVHGFISKLNDSTLKTIEDGDSDKNENIVGAKFISNFDRYYATVIYNFDKSLNVTVMPDASSNPQGFIHGGSSVSFSGFIGPKNHKDLDALHSELIDVIDYGWFTFIAKPMFLLLQFIQGYVGNWGWTIVILTILIKLV